MAPQLDNVVVYTFPSESKPHGFKMAALVTEIMSMLKAEEERGYRTNRIYLFY